MSNFALFALMSLIWGLTWGAIAIGLEAGVPPVLLAALRYALTAILLAAFWRAGLAALLGEWEGFDPAAVSLPLAAASLLFLSLLGTVLAYTLYLRLLRDWGMARAGLYAFVSPIIALIVGWAAFRERIGIIEISGAASRRRDRALEAGDEGGSLSIPHRIAGNLALDFANTISWRGTGRESDYLANPEGLAAWAKESGLDGPTPDKGHAAKARALRDAIGAVGAAFAGGSAPAADALAQLRDVASGALSRAMLVGDPLRPRFAEPDRLLGTVAWSAMELFGGPETGCIKACSFHDCRWLFVDRSKNGSRRWCEMATCGNRAKKLAMAASPVLGAKGK